MSANDKVAATFHGADLPIGTPVTYWRGVHEGPGLKSFTRSNVWPVCGTPVVLVRGEAGGITLTHIEHRELTAGEEREEALRAHVVDLLADVDHFADCKANTLHACTCLIGRIKQAIDPHRLEGAHP